MNLTEEAWHSRAAAGSEAQGRLYMTSCVLVYYFTHLDGDGTGSRWFAYMDKLKEARGAWDEFFKNPAVQKFPDGRFTFPSNLPRPTQARDESYGLEQMAVLLDGRDGGQLQKDVIAGLKKIGIRW